MRPVPELQSVLDVDEAAVITDVDGAAVCSQC